MYIQPQCYTLTIISILYVCNFDTHTHSCDKDVYRTSSRLTRDQLSSVHIIFWFGI